MVLSRSFDNLNDINRGGGGGETIEKKKEGGNIFSRLFKGRTLHAPSRKKTKNKSKKKSSNRSSLADEATSPQGGESSLANSISMPEIAGELWSTLINWEGPGENRSGLGKGLDNSIWKQEL